MGEKITGVPWKLFSKRSEFREFTEILKILNIPKLRKVGNSVSFSSPGFCLVWIDGWLDGFFSAKNFHPTNRPTISLQKNEQNMSFLCRKLFSQ